MRLTSSAPSQEAGSAPHPKIYDNVMWLFCLCVSPNLSQGIIFQLSLVENCYKECNVEALNSHRASSALRHTYTTHTHTHTHTHTSTHTHRDAWSSKLAMTHTCTHRWYVRNELTAVIQFKKYRTMRQRYLPFEWVLGEVCERACAPLFLFLGGM
jgi:hypothetical protein